MGVIKLTEQEDKYILMNTLEKKEVLIKEMVELVTTTGFKGIVPFEIREVKGKRVILNDLTGTYSILTRLQSPIDSRELVLILKGLLDSIKEISSKKIPPTNLDLDLDYIFIRRDGVVMFTLWALQNLVPKRTIPSLLRQIGEEAKPSARKDKNFIDGYLSIFDDNFSMDKLDKFVSSSYDMLKTSAMENTKKPFVAPVVETVTVEAKSAVPTPTPKPSPEPVEEDDDDVLPVTAKTTFLTDLEDDSEDDDGKTAMLTNETEVGISRYLVRLNTDERLDIKSNEVIIGKQGADIVLTGNKAISRQHAKFIVFDGEIMLEDLNSSNGTKLNGAKLKPGEQLKLVNGDTITLANESFLYKEE